MSKMVFLQVIGLKYFDDMQQRIPRTEVEQVHSLVYGVVKDVLAVEGLPDADRLHCRVTGSYIRGKPMTGTALLIASHFRSAAFVVPSVFAAEEEKQIAYLKGIVWASWAAKEACWCCWRGVTQGCSLIAGLLCMLALPA